MIIHGDLFDVLPTLEAESFHSAVTDPPYGIGFMGKEWDTFSPARLDANESDRFRQVDRSRVNHPNPNLRNRSRSPALSPSQIEYDMSVAGLRRFQEWTEQWAGEVMRVLKPGAHLVVCGAPRSHHRMMCGLEDAGFEIRDCLAWLFGSGFPKSSNFGCHCGESSTERDVRHVSGTDVSAAVDAASQPSQVLFDSLPEQSLSTAGSTAASGWPEGTEQLRLEGRRDIQAEQGQLHRAEVRPMPAAVLGDGAVGRLRDGAPASGGDANWSLPPTDGSGASSRPRHSKQRGRQPGTVRQQRRAQASGGRCETCGGFIEWRGWGTALKPGHEPIILARKPFRGSLKDNIARYGVGGLNIDGCRIEGEKPDTTRGAGGQNGRYGPIGAQGRIVDDGYGRWPANVLIDEDVAAMLDEQSGELVASSGNLGVYPGRQVHTYGKFAQRSDRGRSDSGGASRFFYVAKPSREERDLGCFSIEPRQRDESRKDGDPGGDNPRNRGVQRRGNFHPTVKPLALMRWLVRLVTPPGGRVLEPFGGSGTTAMACAAEGVDFVLIEREAEYIPIIEARVRSIAPLFLETHP